MALIAPARSHPGVEIYAVAVRDKGKTEKFAKAYGIQKVHSRPDAYQDLIDDPEVDAIYIPLPNILHYEWTMKALNGGKHVLVEKPIATTAEDAQKMHELAERKGLVLLEAMHIRFHPAVQRVKEIIKRGDIGAIRHVSAKCIFPVSPAGHIAEKFELGKGYPIEIIRNIISSNPLPVASAAYDSKFPHTDDNARVTLEFPDGVTAAFSCKITVPLQFGFILRYDFSVEIIGEKGKIKLSEYMMPQVHHSINVIKDSGEKCVYKAYTFQEGDDSMLTGQPWWSTYRHQLEAFVTKIRGNEPRLWMSQDSVVGMQTIEKIYEKACPLVSCLYRRSGVNHRWVLKPDQSHLIINVL